MRLCESVECVRENEEGNDKMKPARWAEQLEPKQHKAWRHAALRAKQQGLSEPQLRPREKLPQSWLLQLFS